MVRRGLRARWAAARWETGDTRCLSMGLVGGLSNRDIQDRLRSAIDRTPPRAPGSGVYHRARQRPALRRRGGSIRQAIIGVLANSDDLHVQDIYAGVEKVLGEPVAASSVRSCLAEHVSGDDPLFERIARGRYRLHGKLSG